MSDNKVKSLTEARIRKMRHSEKHKTYGPNEKPPGERLYTCVCGGANFKVYESGVLCTRCSKYRWFKDIFGV